MKRIAGLWDDFIAWRNLYSAFLKARRGKQNRASVADFCFDAESLLLTLQSELEQGAYQPGAYRQFVIFERKQRQISAAPFRDRIVHHALMNVMEPIFERRFYYHSYACRKGKGTHRAVDRYQLWARRYPYVLKLDIKRYFPNIQHAVLKQQLAGMVKDTRFFGLLGQVIDSSAGEQTPGCGLPIGNLTSQYFANLYLNNVDHWLSEQSSCKAYLRYVDDLMLFGESKSALWCLLERVKVQLAAIGLQVHETKQQLMRTSERVDVLGYKVSPERRWLRNDNGYRFQRSYHHTLRKGLDDADSAARFKSSVASWQGHALHGETESLRREIFRPAAA